MNYLIDYWAAAACVGGIVALAVFLLGWVL